MKKLIGYLFAAIVVSSCTVTKVPAQAGSFNSIKVGGNITLGGVPRSTWPMGVDSLTKNSGGDSFFVWKNGTYIALKDNITDTSLAHNFYKQATYRASFDTSSRVLTLTALDGSTATVLIPRGAASGTSGIVTLSNSISGDSVTISGDNGSHTTFSRQDARITSGDISNWNGKMNTSDTINKWVITVTKNAAGDSFYIWKNGTHIALKDNSGTGYTSPYSMVNVKDSPFSATGNGITDDWAAIQAAANYAIVNKKATLFFPVGKYKISKGVEFIRWNSDSSDYENVMINVTGDAGAYDNSVGGGTEIDLDSKTDFVFGFEKPKGVTVSNFSFVGQNSGLLNFSIYDISNPLTNWSTNGTSYSKRAPHCAVVIDPYGSSAIDTSNRYAGRFARYLHPGNSGGTDVVINNCHITSFSCGIAISPNGTTQNAEGIVINRVFFSGVTDCVATGNSQTRTCILSNSFAWVGIRSVINGTYGSGISAPCWIQGFLNVAGGVKYLYDLPAWRQDVYVDNVYAELLYAVGGNFSTVNSNFFFRNCFIDFMGSSVMSLKTVKQPLSILNCSSASFIGGRLGFYGTAGGALNINTANNASVLLVGVQLNRPFVSNAIYNGCIISNGAGILADDSHTLYYQKVDNYDGYVPVLVNTLEKLKVITEHGAERYINPNYYASNSLVVAVTFDTSKNTVRFPLSTGDFYRTRAGDVVVLNGSGFVDDFGMIKSFSLANIDSVFWNGSTYIASITGIPNGLVSGNTYSVYTTHPKILKAVHVGVINSGSNLITGVTKEGNDSATIRLVVGDNIFNSSFPVGTYITGISHDTITVSIAATGSQSQSAILTTDYHQVCYGTPTTLSIKTGFHRGDEIINIMSSTDTIYKWICTADGITGSAKLPIFKTLTLGSLGGGTVGVSSGGTGQTSYTDGQMLIGNTTGNTLAKGTITSSNLDVTTGHGTLDISIPSGDVSTWNAKAGTGSGNTTSASTITPLVGERFNYYDVTALATNTTIASPSGTPTNHDGLMIRITSDGTPRTITWNSIYHASTNFALPTVTTASKTMYVQFIYNDSTSAWEATGLTNGF